MKYGKIEKALIEGKLLDRCYIKIKSIIARFFQLLFWDTFNGKNRKRVFRRLDALFAGPPRRRLAQKTPIDNNKILLITTRGSYNCNPRAIAEEIIRQKLPWKLIWVARKEDLGQIEQFPDALELVQRDSYEFYKAMASAKVWIDNSVNLSYMDMPKKEGQILIETWHGSFGLKRFETSKDKVWLKKAAQAGARTDYCLTNSSFEEDLFHRTFWGGSELLPYGHPRNDVLLAVGTPEYDNRCQTVRETLNIAPNVKVALYAPTFRDSMGIEAYSLNYISLRDALRKRFGGEWVVLTRFHFRMQALARKKKVRYPSFVIDATDYPDIQDILCVTDVGITDYSSWVCDYVLTGRPAFIYATDMKDYYSERGFYYPLETTPFPIAQERRQLIENILQFDENLYRRKCEKYLADMNCYETGNASVRLVEKLKEIIGEGDDAV